MELVGILEQATSDMGSMEAMETTSMLEPLSS
jgi:hypothetical protein